ncbi:MAG: hypothetical protein V5A23_00495 [Halobacteriales archaeon]
MDRRSLLRKAGAGVVAGVAGCLGDAPGAGDGTDSPTDTSTPVLVGTDFSIEDVGPGQRVEEAGVSTDGAEVVVDGTIHGNNGCYTAELADAAVESGRLTATIRSYERRPTGTESFACTQAIVEIDYRATATFEGGLPDAVAVVHETPGGTDTVAETTLDGDS